MESSTSQAGKVWFITGASAGLGRDLAELLLAEGAKVVATARRVELLKPFEERYPESALALALDITQPEQIDAALAAALARFGRVDVLVNNAGYGMVGAVEESAESEYRPMFETNVFGLIRMTQAVLPQLRAQGSGFVVNLSSIGGLVGSAGFGMYNATKFAVEGLSEALAQELKPLGIHVLIVEPGPFRTDFLARGEMPAARHIPEYDQSAGKMREYAEKQNGRQPGDPKKAVAAIVRAVEAEQPPLRLLLGAATLPRLQGKLDALQQDITAWHAVTVAADYAPGD